MFSFGDGWSLVEAKFSTALDVEEVLSGVGGDQLHVMVADVNKCPLTLSTQVHTGLCFGSAGLADWFRRAYFSCQSFSSSVEACCRFLGATVALYVPWCRYLEPLTDVKPQLCADNLKCSAPVSRCPSLVLLGSLLSMFVRVGQDVSPGKCVLLSTSKSVRKAMKLWDISGGGTFWKVPVGCQGSWRSS